MSNEQFERQAKKYYNLVEKVRRMRGYQKEYFNYRSSVDLKIARNFERQVDNLISDEIKEQKSKQGEIF